MPIAPLLPLLLLALLLGGCKTLPTHGNGKQATAGILLDHVNHKAKTNQHWFDKRKTSAEKLAKQYKGEVAPAKAVYLENDVRFYKDKPLHDYLQGIADRLLANWQGPDPHLSIVMESGPFFNAYVDELNQLHLSTELLRRLENEDQLAAVIAHELGHVLLRHNRKKATTNLTARALEWGAMVALAQGEKMARKKGKSKYIERGKDAALKLESLGLIWSDMLAPSWSRKHEREADKLGLDLLIRANYNYEEFPSVIEHISDAAAQRSERAAHFSQMADKLIRANKHKAYDLADGRWSKMVGDMVVKSTQFIKETAFNRLDESGKSHDDRSKRIDALKQYLNTAYDGGDLPPEISLTRFNRYIGSPHAQRQLKQDRRAINVLTALYGNKVSTARSEAEALPGHSTDLQAAVGLARTAVALRYRRYDEAIPQLERLSRNREAPAEVYIKLAQSYLARGKPEKAGETLLRGEQRIGRDYRFLPLMVRAQRKAKNTDAAEEYALKCKRYDRKENKAVDTVLTQLGVQSQGLYYRSCIRELGYDVAARRAREEEKKQDKYPASLKDLGDSLKGLFGKR